MANNAKYVGPIFTCVGTLFAAVGIYLVMDAVHFSGQAQEGIGEVIAVDTHYSTDSDGRRTTTYAPTIRFQSIDGDTYEAETHIRSSGYDYSIGTEVEILYDPADPDEVRINSFWSLYMLPGMFTLMGSLFAILGAFLWWNKIGHGQRTQSSMTGGTVWRSRDD